MVFVCYFLVFHHFFYQGLQVGESLRFRWCLWWVVRCGWWMIGILVGGLVIGLVLVEIRVVVLRFSVCVLVSLLMVVVLVVSWVVLV